MARSSQKKEGFTALVRQLKSDETFMTQRRVTTNLREQVDQDKIREEVKNIQSIRPMRKLAGKTPSADALWDAMAKDLAYRARLIEIRSELSPRLMLLRTTIDSMNGYVNFRYGDELRAGASTATDKKAALRRILTNAHELQDEFEDLVEYVDLVIKDIDQASYAASNLTRLIQIILDKHRVG